MLKNYQKAQAQLGLSITNCLKNHIHLTVITGIVIISSNMVHKLQLGVLLSPLAFLEKR